MKAWRRKGKSENGFIVTMPASASRSARSASKSNCASRWCIPASRIDSPTARSLKFLTRKEFAVVTQAATRILGLPDDAGADIGAFIDDLLYELPATSQRQARLMLRVVEHGTHLFDLKPKRFTRLAPAEKDAYLRGWMESSLGARRLVFRALKMLAALGYYATATSWESIGYDGPWLGRLDARSEFTHEEPVTLDEVEDALGSS